LKLLLRPDNNYSGIGYIIDGFGSYLLLSGILNAFLLLILGFIFRFCFKRFVDSQFINITFGLLGEISLFFSCADLWGVRICMSSWSALIIIDFILMMKNKVQIGDKFLHSKLQ
jgi:hypothetical protein